MGSVCIDWVILGWTQRSVYDRGRLCSEVEFGVQKREGDDIATETRRRKLREGRDTHVFYCAGGLSHLTAQHLESTALKVTASYLHIHCSQP